MDSLFDCWLKLVQVRIYTFPSAGEGSIPQARGESTNESAAYSIIETVLSNYQTEPAEGKIASPKRLPDLFYLRLYRFIRL